MNVLRAGNIYDISISTEPLSLLSNSLNVGNLVHLLLSTGTLKNIPPPYLHNPQQMSLASYSPAISPILTVFLFFTPIGD
jgi:hypothetical protein